MQTHPLDGDGLNVELFKVLGRVSKVSVVNEALPFRIPDTILYYGSPSYWYFFDEQTNSVQKHPAKSLEKSNVFERFCERSPSSGRSDILAYFASSKTETMDITYLDKEGLRNFLFGKRQERYGILQRFVEPKMDHCETVQVVHSPTMTFAVRRQNRAKLYDRSVPINLRCCGFDGPSYQCEEYFCMANQTGSYRSMGAAFVNFFSGLEPSFVLKRFVAYFRHGADDFKYLLFTSSVRITERIDPEPDALWGKKPIPHAALKQSLQCVSTVWNPNSTGGSLGSTPGNGPDGVLPGGAIGGKLLQPLTLIPQEQLDRISTVPSRAKEMEALSKQYKMAKHKTVRSVPAVSRRLLSPFQTISVDEGSHAQENTSIQSQKVTRIRELRKRAAAIDKENDEINRRLQSLEKDAASLCMMSELDKIANRRRSPSPLDPRSPSSDDGDMSLEEDGDEGSFGRRWMDRSASVASVTSDVQNSTPRTASSVGGHFISDELLEMPNVPTRHAKHGSASFTPSADGYNEGSISRAASIIAVPGRLRKRKSMSIAKKDSGRPCWSPRSYSTRSNAAMLEKMLEGAAHRFVLDRSKNLMNCAALLSDLFYPLAETVAIRRTWIPKYLRHERAYGEAEGIIRVDEDGAIHFDMPRAVFLAAQRELGAYWGTLRIEINSDANFCPDAPEFPSTEEWDVWQDEVKTRKQQQEAAREEAKSDGENEPLTVEDDPFPFDDRRIPCVLRQPFPNQSAFTFASRKLQEVAESLERDYQSYTTRAAAAVKQFSHFELSEGIMEACASRAKRDTQTGLSGTSPPSQELNPAANRARRASMLQQLRSLPGRQSAVAESLGTPAEKPLGITPRSDGSGQGTPRSRRASHASSTPSEDALLNDVQPLVESNNGQSLMMVESEEPTASSRRVVEGERRPTAVFILPEESEQRQPQQSTEDDTPEWLR